MDARSIRYGKEILVANTRTSTKRARQAIQRQSRNQMIRTQTKTAVRIAFDAIRTGKTDELRALYRQAVRALSKAASKGGIPRTRAARKISRMTRFLQQHYPDALRG